MNAEPPEPLPARQPGTHLPTWYRAEASSWSRRTGVIALPWAESVPYEVLERVRATLPRA